MFGFRKKSNKVKELERQLAEQQKLNEELIARVKELEKQNDLMKRAMTVVNNAKKGMK